MELVSQGVVRSPPVLQHRAIAVNVQFSNTIRDGGSIARAQNVGLEWSGWMDRYPLDCYDY